MRFGTVLKVDEITRQVPWLDQLGSTIQGAAERAFEASTATLRARDFLNGTWLGHPLHAALTDLPVGLWTGALVLDTASLTGSVTPSRAALRRAADWCVGLGLATAVSAALAGLADYSEIEDPQRRDATAHLLINILGTSAFATSFVLRRSNRWSAAMPFSFLGYGLILLGADIGGHLVYNLGTLVSREAWQDPPRDLTPVLASEDLSDGQMRCVEANGMPILLSRIGGVAAAIGNTCTHWGCSLAEGRIEGNTVKCPCHGSVFDLRSGHVVEGPASEPVMSFEVHEANGHIAVKILPSSVG